MTAPAIPKNHGGAKAFQNIIRRESVQLQKLKITVKKIKDEEKLEKIKAHIDRLEYRQSKYGGFLRREILLAKARKKELLRQRAEIEKKNAETAAKREAKKAAREAKKVDVKA